MEKQVVEIELPNGELALARVAVVDDEREDEAEAEEGATKTAFGFGSKKFKFDEIGTTLEGLAGAIKGSLDSVAPDKVSVQLGLELVAKGGHLTGLLVDGEGHASLVVTLEWSGNASE